MCYEGRAPSLSARKRGLGADAHAVFTVFENAFLLNRICAKCGITLTLYMEKLRPPKARSQIILSSALTTGGPWSMTQL